MGTGSYSYVLQYFPPNIAGNIFLLEPVVAQILGLLFKLDNYPGVMTYIGGFGIIIGLALLMKGDELNKNEKTLNTPELSENEEIEISHTSLLNS